MNAGHFDCVKAHLTLCCEYVDVEYVVCVEKVEN